MLNIKFIYAEGVPKNPTLEGQLRDIVKYALRSIVEELYKQEAEIVFYMGFPANNILSINNVTEDLRKEANKLWQAHQQR